MRFDPARFWPFDTLRRQLIWGGTLFLAGMMALLAWTSFERERDVLRDLQTRNVTALARSIAFSSSGWLVANDYHGLQEIIEAQRDFPDLSYAMIVEADGLVVAHTDRKHLGQYMRDLPGRAEPAVISRMDGLIDVTYPVVLEQHLVGWVRIGTTQLTVGRRMAETARNELGYVLAALLVTVILANIVARRLTRRLYAIQSVADAVQSGNTAMRVRLEGTDEAARLGQQFNRMLDTLEQEERELRNSETRFRSMLGNSPIAVRIAKSGGRNVVFANQRYNELINAGPGHVIGADPKIYYTHPEDYEDILRHLGAGRQIFNRLVELTIPGHGTKWALASYLPIQYEGEAAVLGWFYDITDRKQTEEKLTLAARVFSEAHEGIVITDADGAIIDVNPTFCDITGYSHDEVIGQNSRILKSGKNGPEFYAAMWKALTEDGHWQGEVWNRKKNGEIYAELLTISALRDETGRTRHYVGLFSDITQAKHQQHALELMAHYDMLTKLPNRVLFADRFSQAIAHSKRDESLLAVCYLDLDGFKQVNDTMGHEAGDRLLIEVADRIKSSLREEDTLSRLGGDEFALLMGDIETLAQCEQALARIHQAVAQPFLIDDQPVTVSVSSGVTLYPLDDADPDTLLRHADQAMYQAKLEGRNRYHLFDAAHDQQLQSHRQQLNAIEEAFARHEFCLHYQPKVHMTTGEVSGAEALIRWNHSERGILPPAEFLPVVEGTSFEIDLGNWVIDQALRQIEDWNQAGLQLQVSVNIAPRHLQWALFATQLEATLALYPHIPSHQLQLEVLESSVLGDLPTVSEVLRICRDTLGVSIALDDFGTGYSSLTHLRRLPADTIKIDQSFVHDMIDDPSDYAIVEGVVGLAGAFRREVIAEGVETREHGLMLLTMGCMLAQGYGIARPMPADAVVEWVRHYRPDAEWQNFSVHPLSTRDTLEMLLRTEVGQWGKRMEECLQADHESVPYWPIMDDEKCHCGRWVTYAGKAQLFGQESLDRLDRAHQELHRIGNHLKHLFQQGRIKEARAGIPSLKAALHAIEERLGQLT